MTQSSGLHNIGPFGAAPFEKNSRKVDFRLAFVSKFHIFKDFSPLYGRWRRRVIENIGNSVLNKELLPKCPFIVELSLTLNRVQMRSKSKAQFGITVKLPLLLLSEKD